MHRIQLLNKSSFSAEFEKCCNEYDKLKMASAWCGDPSHVLPYSYLTPDKGNLDVEIIMGVSFNHTHPNAIRLFMDNGFDVKIFRVEMNLFHPKFYFFTKENKFALFTGSSNFTYSGFFNNEEINTLIEGNIKTTKGNYIKEVVNQFEKWKSDKYSFPPNDKWLKKYTKDYIKQKNIERKNNIPSPSVNEESISASNWLSQANWKLYYKKVKHGLSNKERSEFGYSEVLDAVSEHLPLPWSLSVFNEIENRRIIGGMGKYGWLGHVAASGGFRKFMTNGSNLSKRKAINTINKICSRERPIDYDLLSQDLEVLTKLGPTLKVWSRVLTILRPDIYCTVASPSVRENLSKTLEIPKLRLITVNGYIELLKMLHSCPWYNSPEPYLKSEKNIWRRRGAFMDAIFY